MARTEKIYQRLPGKKKSFIIGYHTLWQGADHLLSIYSRFGMEEYKRFYFNDIEAIIVHKTDTGKIQNLILGLIMGLFAIMVFTLEGGLAVLGGIMAGCFLVFLGVNWFRGPTCITHIRTAVQNEKLHSLNRLKNTHKVMDRLKLRIENIQGHLSPEELNQKLLKGQKTGPGASAPPVSWQSEKSIRSESGAAHLSLFSLFLLDGLLVLLNAQLHMTAITLISMLTGMGIGICVIIALVKQRGSNMPEALCNLTWTGLGLVCISFLLGQIYSYVLYFKNPMIMGNHWKLLELVAGMSFFENSVVSILNILTLCGTFCLGIPGLLMVDKHRKELKGNAAKREQTVRTTPPFGNQ